jgi:hypothetical protein
VNSKKKRLAELQPWQESVTLPAMSRMPPYGRERFAAITLSNLKMTYEE